MAYNVNIPDELTETFRRLMNQIPEKLRNDSHTQQVAYLYLKLGGERLARQYIDIMKLTVREEERHAIDEAEDSDMDEDYSDYDS
ncbi:MAG: hypothetical protein LJE66_05930 [Desulfobacterales bacterium]|jgi:hypothetical protein|nr:hypothetical protein [Desulfobacterales bacterium]